jgi:putative ABC transport system substrate-binding protein
MMHWWLAPVVLLVLVSGARAEQKQAMLHRVVVLVTGGPTLIPPQLRGLRDGLEEAGYIEGKNLAIDLLQGEDYKSLDASLKRLMHHRIDAIVTASAAETSIARGITNEIPIIFMPAGNPVALGFVKSLSKPGTNLTGLTFFRDFEDTGKQLQVFKQVVPALRKVTTFYDGRKENVFSSSSLEALKRVAAHLGIQLSEKPVASISEAERAIKLLPRTTTSGVFLICGPMFRSLEKIAAIAVQKRLPLFGCAASQVAEENVLLTYAPDLYNMGYRGAWYVDRILKGAKPQDLPVENPAKFELTINLKTANEIGLTIPPDVLMLADRVFQ